jgi:methionyl-tRNA synthetase
VFIHGFLLMDEHKMSKSLGNVLDPFKVMDIYGTDALRYYLLREVAFGGDGSISPEGFETRYNTELANEYGNLASRSLAMIGRYRDGVVPESQAPAELAAESDAVKDGLDRADLSGALEHLWLRVRALNRFVTDTEPWQLSKDESKAAELDSVLYALAEGLRVVSVLLHPWVPESAEKLLTALGREDRSLDTAGFGQVGGGARIGDLGQLFPKVEPTTADAA